MFNYCKGTIIVQCSKVARKYVYTSKKLINMQLTHNNIIKLESCSQFLGELKDNLKTIVGEFGSFFHITIGIDDQER